MVKGDNHDICTVHGSAKDNIWRKWSFDVHTSASRLDHSGADLGNLFPAQQTFLARVRVEPCNEEP